VVLGRFDVVVITVGAFRASVEKGSLSLSQFHSVVFDECHNARGDHAFCSILKKVGPGTVVMPFKYFFAKKWLF
jgi:ERCC4-related helicase